MATNPFTISPLPRGTVPLRMGGMRWQALQFIILKTHLYIYIYVYIYIYKYLYNSSPGLQSAGVLGSSRPMDVIGGAREPVGRRTCTRYHLV